METIFNSSEFCKPQYDPFASPPNFIIAQNHSRAHLVGRTIKSKNPKICDCCLRIIDKQPIDLRCNDAQLSFLGTSIVLYFWFLKAILISLAFLLLFYLFITKIYNEQFNCCTISQEFLVSIKMQKSGSIILVVAIWVSLSILVFILKRYTERQIWSIQKGSISQQMYTLKLVNLGQCQINQAKTWVRDACGEKVVELQLVYDINEVQDIFLKRQKLTQQKNKLIMNRTENEENLYNSQTIIDTLSNKKQQIQELNSQIAKLDSILNKYKNCISVVPGKQIGIAFVMFESVKSRIQAMQHFEQGVKTKKQTAIFKEKQINIEKTTNPKDIIWQNLNKEKYYINILLQICLYMLGITVLLLLLYSCRTYIDLSQVRQKQLIILSAIFILYSLLHALVHLLVYLQIKFSHYQTYTSQELASFRIYTTLNTLTALVLPYLFAHSQQELILYINFTTIIDASIHPLIKIFDFSNLYRIVLLQYIKNLTPTKNPYTQNYLNRLFQGRSFKLGQNYHYLLRSIAVSSFHCYAAPLVFLYYLLGMIGEYITQKYLLLRACKTPPKFTIHLTLTFICYFSLIPTIFLLGVVTFLKQQNQLDVTNTLAIAICLILSKGVSIYITAKMKSFTIQYHPKETYYNSKPKFGQFYEMQNPINKYNGKSIFNFIYNPQQICTSPQFSAIDLFLNEQQKSTTQTKKKQMRCINRLMSYNNEPTDLQMSYQYKRLCDT